MDFPAHHFAAKDIVAAVEVKASAMGASAFAALQALRDQLGKRFQWQIIWELEFPEQN
jgi:hypothetical protein